MSVKTPMTEERKRELVARFGPSTMTFVACIALTDSRHCLVHHRRHRGRQYVMLRYWQRHKRLGCWYPSKINFVLPVDRVGAIIKAIDLAADEREGVKPEWLIQWEAEEAGKA